MIKRLIIAACLLGLIGGGLIFYNLLRDTIIETVFANFPEQTSAVTTYEVAPQDWQPILSTTGTLKAAQEINLTVETPGIIRAVQFAANQSVSRGDVLLQLDDETQKADLAAAQGQLRLAQANSERARKLVQRGVTADANLDTTDAALQAAQAQLARAQAMLDTRQVTAPFSGRIGLARVDAGSYVAPGSVIASLQDVTQMRVEFSLPESELAAVSVGQKLRVIPDRGDTSSSAQGEVTAIDPRIDASSRLFDVQATVPSQAGGVSLTPGQFVQVELALPAESDVLAVPQTAVISSLYGDHVYVVKPRATVEKPPQAEPDDKSLLQRLAAQILAGGDKPADAADETAKGEDSPADDEVFEAQQVFVETGRRSGDWVELRGTAIRAGDLVVTSGQNRLSNGGRVEINNSVDLALPPPPSSARAAEPPPDAPATAQSTTRPPRPATLSDTAQP